MHALCELHLHLCVNKLQDLKQSLLIQIHISPTTIRRRVACLVWEYLRATCSSGTFLNISPLLPWKQANPHATSETVAEIYPTPKVHTYIDVALRHRHRPGASQATSITCNFPAFAAINFTGAQQQQQQQQLERRRRGIRATPNIHTYKRTQTQTQNQNQLEATRLCHTPTPPTSRM